jgi:DNA polymerase III delta prime subunit
MINFMADRTSLHLLTENYRVYRDPQNRFFARYETPPSVNVANASQPIAATPATAPTPLSSGVSALPLPSQALINDIQSRFSRETKRSVSLLHIKDAMAQMVPGDASGTQPKETSVLAAIGSVSTTKQQAAILQTAHSDALFVGHSGCNIVALNYLEQRYDALFISPKDRGGTKIADIARDYLKNKKLFIDSIPSPLKDLMKIFETHFPTLGVAQRRIIIAWLLGVLTKEQMPLLLLTGPSGCGKTYLADILASLFSRNNRYNLDLPKLQTDLHKRLTDEVVVIFDNVRSIPTATSDELCRLITGGHISSGGPQFAAYGHLQASRIIMTSIHNPIEAEDLASRALVIDLTPDKQNPALPIMLGKREDIRAEIGINLLAALAKAMKVLVSATAHQSLTQLGSLTSSSYVDYRFKAFLDHIMHVELQLGNSLHMAVAVVESLSAADLSSADDEPLIILIEALLDKHHSGYSGSAHELIKELRKSEQAKIWKGERWLVYPRSLSVALKHLKHTLASRSIEYIKSAAREHHLVRLPPAFQTTISQSAVTTPRSAPPLKQVRNP